MQTETDKDTRYKPSETKGVRQTKTDKYDTDTKAKRQTDKIF